MPAPAQAEHERDESGGGDDLPEPEPGAGPFGLREAPRDVVHEVGQDRPGDAAEGLRDEVRRDPAAGQSGPGPAAGHPVDDGDDGVQVRAGDRRESEDQHGEPQCRGQRALEQLQSGVGGGEPAGGDARAHDHRDQETGAETFREQGTTEWWSRQHGRRPTDREEVARSS